MEPVPLANPENAFKGGSLDAKFMIKIVSHCNFWHTAEVKLPSTEWGSAAVLVSNAGVIFDFTKLKVPNGGTPSNPYEMDITQGGSAATDVWFNGKPYVSDGGAEIVGTPPWIGVIYKGPRLWAGGDHTQTMTDSNGDTTSFNAYTLYIFEREVTYRTDGSIYKIGPEVQRILFDSTQSILTQT